MKSTKSPLAPTADEIAQWQAARARSNQDPELTPLELRAENERLRAELGEWQERSQRNAIRASAKKLQHNANTHAQLEELYKAAEAVSASSRAFESYEEDMYVAHVDKSALETLRLVLAKVKP